MENQITGGYLQRLEERRAAAFAAWLAEVTVLTGPRRGTACSPGWWWYRWSVGRTPRQAADSYSRRARVGLTPLPGV